MFHLIHVPDLFNKVQYMIQHVVDIAHQIIRAPLLSYGSIVFCLIGGAFIIIISSDCYACLTLSDTRFDHIQGRNYNSMTLILTLP